MQDSKPIVVSAAVRALAYLSKEDPRTKGLVARALVKAWLVSKDPQKSMIFRSMVEAAQRNYGSDEEEWAKWAERLP
jgi:hypothetical protein